MMEPIQIMSTDYVYCHTLQEHPAALASFNALAGQTYGLHFDQVGGDYEPHVLLHGGQVVANVSVNRIPLVRRGQRLLGIQLGTVMTDPAWRHRGLSRWLMETVLRQWLGHCDALYLFANDTVLDFYPKFGFRPAAEWVRRVHVPRSGGALRRLDVTRAADEALLRAACAQGNPWAALTMVDNWTLVDFYARGFRRDCFYYAPALGVVLVLEEAEGQLWCLDVFGRAPASLTEVLALLPPSPADEIWLGFAPADPVGTLLPHHEEDTTLFVHADAGDPFGGEPMLFPLLSHA